jgi:hypothetical protein
VTKSDSPDTALNEEFIRVCVRPISLLTVRFTWNEVLYHTLEAQGFPTMELLTFGVMIFYWGAILCTVGYRATSLVSIHKM